MNNFDFERPRRRFYRDSERGVVLGVCAGLADYFELPVWAVRVAAVVIAWFFVVPAVVAYLIAALLMGDKPLRYRGRTGERSFWRMHARRS